VLSAVAIVGRPNVGKSTLFNRLTRSRDALVADLPGVTRDRRYGIAVFDDRSFLVIDTGGLSTADSNVFGSQIDEQVEIALDEANVVVLVMDYKDGVTAEDGLIADRLRRSGKPVLIAVNKSEGVAPGLAEAEFHALGIGEPVGIAAMHGQGIGRLCERIIAFLGPDDETREQQADTGPRIAVIGRPNVGKSTFVNRLLRANRQVTSAEPGTTRDSILVPCERDGQRFALIDTAGIRRRARVMDSVEKFSIVQSLQAVHDAEVVIVMLDAREGVTDQDVHLVGIALEQGRALVIGLNKWDGLDSSERRQVERQAQRKLDFVPFAVVHYLSALHGSGISEVIHSALEAYESAGRSLATPRLNEVLAAAVAAHPPPIVRGRQVRLRYAHQGGRFPPLIVIHGNQVERLPAHYRRYLENAFRSALKLRGTPIRIELKSGENPFAGRRNKLTPRQERRRQRLFKHSRGR